MESEKSLTEYLLNFKWTPVLLMVLSITFFFHLIPEHIAERFDIFLGIVGGVITLILSIWTVASLTPELLDKYPIIVGLICISTLFVFGYYFILKTHNFSTKELTENGVYTESVVVSKLRIFNLKGNAAHSMKVSYRTEDNRRIKGKILLSRSEYSYFKKGMKVPVYYSSKHPTIVRIDYKRFKRVEPDFMQDIFP